MIRLDAELLKKTGIFALVSGELLAFVGGGYWLGDFLDERWRTAPWCAAGFATLGLVYAVWRIFRLVKEWMRDQRK